MSIWQGAADTTVAPANRMELVKQWTGVHGIDGVAPVADTVDGQSHAVYKDSTGKVLVETYEIAGMDHGVAVAPSASCGATAAHAFDKGICAASRVATFFGVTGSSPGPVDAGPDAKPGSSTSSGGVSSSSSTGGVAPDAAGTSSGGASSGAASGGAGSSGGAADPGAVDPNGRHGSTCSVSLPVGDSSSSAPLALLGAFLTLTVALARSRSRSAVDKAVTR
jgi:hypothetical protein